MHKVIKRLIPLNIKQSLSTYINKKYLSLPSAKRCFKCVKAMVAMDALGVLDNYTHVFDLELYNSERMKHLGWILYDAKKFKSSQAIEIIQEGRKTSGFIPLQAYHYAFSRGSRNLRRKLQRRK